MNRRKLELGQEDANSLVGVLELCAHRHRLAFFSVGPGERCFVWEGLERGRRMRDFDRWTVVSRREMYRMNEKRRREQVQHWQKTEVYLFFFQRDNWRADGDGTGEGIIE